MPSTSVGGVSIVIDTKYAARNSKRTVISPAIEDLKIIAAPYLNTFYTKR